MSKEDGGAAFPNKIVLPRGTMGGTDGMTLRDYFAARALVAIASRWQGTIGDIDGAAMDRTARAAYAVADAMIMARQ